MSSLYLPPHPSFGVSLFGSVADLLQSPDDPGWRHTDQNPGVPIRTCRSTGCPTLLAVSGSINASQEDLGEPGTSPDIVAYIQAAGHVPAVVAGRDCRQPRTAVLKHASADRLTRRGSLPRPRMLLPTCRWQTRRRPSQPTDPTAPPSTPLVVFARQCLPRGMYTRIHP